MVGPLLSILVIISAAAPSLAAAQTEALPVPATSQPPPQIDCMAGPYIVFFSPGSAGLRPAAVEILDHVILASRMPCGNGSLVVAGHTDRSGRVSRNLALSRRRAAAVAHYLEAHGIPRKDVITLAFGARRPLDETKDRLHEPDNRRVEVVFGPDLRE